MDTDRRDTAEERPAKRARVDGPDVAAEQGTTSTLPTERDIAAAELDASDIEDEAPMDTVATHSSDLYLDTVRGMLHAP